MRIATFKKAIPYLTKANIAALVWGHHGVGKSQAVHQYCKENKLGFVDLRLGTQEVGDLLGLQDFKVNEEGERVATKFMRPEWFPTEPESKGIIFLDEINRASRDVLQAVFQLVLDRKIHTYELPKGWHVIGASNPNTEDYIVADIGDKAFMDRFCHISLTPSAQEWLDYARDKEFDSSIINFIATDPGNLQEKLEECTVVDEVKPSRRSWEAVDRLIKAGTPWDVLQELCYGLVGNASTIAYIESIKSADKPFSALDVLQRYTKLSKKVKEYGDSKKNEGGRFDLLKATCDNVLKHISKYVEEADKSLLEKEEANLRKFLKDLPVDISFSLARELYRKPKMRSVIDKDPKIMDIMESARPDLKKTS